MCSTQICIDSEIFQLPAQFNNTCYYAHVILSWRTEVYIFMDDSHKEITEKDFEFEANLN